MSTVSRKRVAALVAIYRAGQFIDAKLQTLSRQSAFHDCQIVLLNCQNIDNERSRYHKFAAENDNVTVIEYDKHRRLYTTWNDGIEASDSDYITNSNCDDMLHPDCFAHLIAALDDNPDYDVAHANSYVTDVPNQHWPAWHWHGLIEAIYPLGTAGPCPIWRRSLHQKFGYFSDYRTIGDARLWERWHAHGVKFLNVPLPLSLYYHAPGHNLEMRYDEISGKTLRDLDIEDDLNAP